MDVDEWLDNIASVSSSAMAPKVTAAAAAAAAAEHGSEDGDDYIRIGRRTAEDEDGDDISTQYIVVAKVNVTKRRVWWFSVATWQLNGLRVGSLHAGDSIREDDDSFSLSTGLDPDPYFFARNLLSPARIREHLLELCRSDVRIQAETYDDEVAQTERNHAQWARMVQDHGPQVISSEDMRAVAGQDPKQRFPHPWALPVALTDSWDPSFIGIKPGPNRARRRRAKQEWLPTFDSIGKGGEISSVNVIAIFVNDFDDRNLRLKHFIEIHLDPDESFESARDYFLEGDGRESTGFGGLNNNSYLSKLGWSLELWVLPQMDGCSTLIKWDDVPQLEARALCDWSAVQKCNAAKLYIEVRMVEKKSRQSSPIESEADVVTD